MINSRFKQIFRSQTARRRQQPRQSHPLEVLEQRTLLSAVTSYDIEVAEPFAPVEFDGSVYFVGNSTTGSGSSLYSINNGTQTVVYDLGDVGSPAIVVMNDKLFFPVQTAADGIELYESDGTTAGTQLLSDIRPGTDSSLSLPFWEDTVIYNDKMIFTADDGIHGFEVWTSDGTEAGTELLKDVRPFGSSSSGPRHYSFGKEGVFFRANDGIHGIELWVTDGTTEGTTIRANLSSGSDSSQIKFISETPDGVFFSVAEALWFATTPDEFPTFTQTHSPQDATTFNGEIHTLTQSSNSFESRRLLGGAYHGVLNDRLIFSLGTLTYSGEFQQLNDYGANYGLLSTDGTNVEWIREHAFEEFFGFGHFSNFPNQPVRFESVQHDGQIFYSGVENGSFGLWVTDGTAAGTKHIALAETSLETSPRDFAVHNDRVWFLSDDLLYSTDGTTAGTVQESNTFYPYGQPFSTSHGLLLATDDQVHAFTSGPPAAPVFITPQSTIQGSVEWESVPAISFYEVYQAATGAPPTDPNFQFDRTTDPSTQVEPWGQMQVYVRSVQLASNGDRVVSDWTRGVFYNAPMPTQLSPIQNQLAEQAHGISGFQLGVEFRFETTPGASVQIQIFRPDDPTTQVGGKSFIEDSARIIFPSEGEFLYRIRQQGTSGTSGIIRYSEWSDFKTIHVISDGVKLITPNAESDARPTFRWTRYFGSNHTSSQNAADRYTLQVSNRTTGDDRVIFVEDLHALEYTPDFDLPAGNYEAWVLPKNAGNPIGWTDPITFSVGMEITDVTPQGQIADSTPTLQWDAIDGDVKYEVWVNKHGGPGGIVRADNLLTNSYQITQPLDDGLYRVWIRARFGEGTNTAWSEPVTFNIGDKVVPEIIGPAGAGTDNTPLFQWSGPSSVTNWRLFIHDHNSGQDIVIPENEITSTSYTFSENFPDSRYTVWVRGYQGDEAVTVWSPPQKFSIGQFPTLTGPDPIVVQNSPMTFEWNQVSGAVRYEFLSRHVQAKETAFHRTDLTTTSISRPYLLPTGGYRAWVRAIMADGSTTRWSDLVEFTVIDEIRYSF